GGRRRVQRRAPRLPPRSSRSAAWQARSRSGLDRPRKATTVPTRSRGGRGPPRAAFGSPSSAPHRILCERPGPRPGLPQLTDAKPTTTEEIKVEADRRMPEAAVIRFETSRSGCDFFRSVFNPTRTLSEPGPARGSGGGHHASTDPREKPFAAAAWASECF